MKRVPRRGVQGYLAHKKTPTPLGPPQDPRHRPTVGSQGGALSYERGARIKQHMQRISRQGVTRTDSKANTDSKPETVADRALRFFPSRFTSGFDTIQRGRTGVPRSLKNAPLGPA